MTMTRNDENGGMMMMMVVSTSLTSKISLTFMQPTNKILDFFVDIGNGGKNKLEGIREMAMSQEISYMQLKTANDARVSVCFINFYPDRTKLSLFSTT